jgi:hypothetical protein
MDRPLQIRCLFAKLATPVLTGAIIVRLDHLAESLNRSRRYALLSRRVLWGSLGAHIN